DLEHHPADAAVAAAVNGHVVVMRSAAGARGRRIRDRHARQLESRQLVGVAVEAPTEGRELHVFLLQRSVRKEERHAERRRPPQAPAASIGAGRSTATRNCHLPSDFTNQSTKARRSSMSCPSMRTRACWMPVAIAPSPTTSICTLSSFTNTISPGIWRMPSRNRSRSVASPPGDRWTKSVVTSVAIVATSRLPIASAIARDARITAEASSTIDPSPVVIVQDDRPNEARPPRRRHHRSFAANDLPDDLVQLQIGREVRLDEVHPQRGGGAGGGPVVLFVERHAR